MGTIVIEEYAKAGSLAQADQTVYKLDTLLARTADATTSTTAESLTLNKDTNYVRIYTVEVHRLAVGADNTATKYTTTEAAKWHDFGTTGGKTLYFRSDV